MTKTRTPRGKRQELKELPQAVTVQMPLPLMATLNDVGQGFHSLCIEAGRQVLSAMMEHDRTGLCGPKWMPDPERKAMRGGHTTSLVVLGGRQIEVKRPRARSVDGAESELASYRWAAAGDPLDDSTIEAIVSGVSTRNYLDPLPSGEREVATPPAVRSHADSSRSALRWWASI